MRILRGRRRLLLMLLVLTLALALDVALPLDVLARGGGGGHAGAGAHPGGGGGFHPGGGGGGFSPGGGGGGFHGFGPAWLFFLPGGGLSLGLILLIAVVLIAFYFFSRREAQPAWTPGPPLEVLDPGSRFDPSGLAEIEVADPRFDPNQFLTRVQTAFGVLEQAWQDRDLGAARPYMGEGLYLSWQTQIGQMIAQKRKNVLEGLQLERATVVEASHGSRHDHISVLMEASAADYEVDETTGNLTFGSRSAAPFREYWTFERSSGALTPEGGGTLAGSCPNCGAPLAINEVGECRYCTAAVTSGRYDWVLSRIEQSEEWEARQDLDLGRLAPAALGWPPPPTKSAQRAAQSVLAQIHDDDPAFDAEVFMQHAQMAFFLLEQAVQAGRPEQMRPYLGDEEYARWQSRLAGLAKQNRRELLDNLNVQGTHLFEARHGAAGDQITVRVDAVAADKLVDASTGAVLEGDAEDRRFSRYCTFERAPGTKTPEAGVLDSKCPSCGSPLSLAESGACRHCGAAVASGHFDWVISRIETPEQWDARSQTADLPKAADMERGATR